MSVIYLVANNQSNIEKGKPVYEKSVVVGNGETSDPIIAPDESGPVEYWQIGIVTGGNTGRFEFTLSPRADVIAGNALWRSSDAGNVSTDSTDSLTPVQGVRAVSVSGPITIEVVAI